MNEAKTYTIRVLTDQYVIKSDEKQEHVDASAQLVNKLVHEIVENNKHIDHKKAAVLAALRIASRLVHLQDELEAMQYKHHDIISLLEKELCTLES